MGILVDYSDVGYRVLINNLIIVARHVDIVEGNVNCINLDKNDYGNESNASAENELNDSVFKSADETDEVQSNAKKSEKDSLTPQILRRSTRERKSPIRYPKNSTSNVSVHYCRVDTPSTFEEALNRNNCENWKKVMDKE